MICDVVGRATAFVDGDVGSIPTGSAREQWLWTSGLGWLTNQAPHLNPNYSQASTPPPPRPVEDQRNGASRLQSRLRRRAAAKVPHPSHVTESHSVLSSATSIVPPELPPHPISPTQHQHVIRISRGSSDQIQEARALALAKGAGRAERGSFGQYSAQICCWYVRAAVMVLC
jgi:hypothetical protein